jgi:hypothetical protein
VPSASARLVGREELATVARLLCGTVMAEIQKLRVETAEDDLARTKPDLALSAAVRSLRMVKGAYAGTAGARIRSYEWDCGAHRVGAGVPVLGERPATCRCPPDAYQRACDRGSKPWSERTLTRYESKSANAKARASRPEAFARARSPSWPARGRDASPVSPRRLGRRLQALG